MSCFSLNFLTRRNSENHLKVFPKELSEDNQSLSSNSYSSSVSTREPVRIE